ncbi:hypothetical protein PHISP_06478 [Aspergillus sp. HF37]|nr:hypothetical protein PHISP_06478 [Aspergillus sp. HF37]
MAATMFLAWLLYMFATAPTFGPDSGCNDQTVFVIFGINIVATEPALRWALVGCIGLILLGYTLYLVFTFVGFVFTFVGFCRLLLQRRPPRDDASSDFIDEPGPSVSWADQIPYWLISHTGGCIYIICMLELMFQRNNLSRTESEWSFGQTLAMLMLTGPLIELLSLVLSVIDKRSGRDESAA